MIVYTSLMGNTRKFVNKVNAQKVEVTEENCLNLVIEEPYILIVPTYSATTTDFLWDFIEQSENQANCRGIFGGGNQNFANLFCYTAKELSEAYHIPLLHLFELQGSAKDVSILEKELEKIDTNK